MAHARRDHDHESPLAHLWRHKAGVVAGEHLSGDRVIWEGLIRHALDFLECGRQDSNLHGRLGAGKLAKVWCPAAPKAAVYAYSTTPALCVSQILVYASSGGIIRLRVSHGFHAIAEGAPGRDTLNIPAFLLQNFIDNFLCARHTTIIKLVTPQLAILRSPPLPPPMDMPRPPCSPRCTSTRLPSLRT